MIIDLNPEIRTYLIALIQGHKRSVVRANSEGNINAEAMIRAFEVADKVLDVLGVPKETG